MVQKLDFDSLPDGLRHALKTTLKIAESQGEYPAGWVKTAMHQVFYDSLAANANKKTIVESLASRYFDAQLGEEAVCEKRAKQDAGHMHRTIERLIRSSKSEYIIGC